MGNRLRGWARAGAVGLLPIAPKGVKLAPGCGLDPGQLGKIPAQPNGHDTWTSVLGWSRYEATAAELERWDAANAGAGLLLNENYVAPDLDEDRPAVAETIAAAVVSVVGDVPCRGRTGSPRRAWLFRQPAGAPIRFQTVSWVLGGIKGKLEIQAGAKQLVIDGPHRDGDRYVWNRPTRSAVIADLIELTPEMVVRLVAAVDRAVAALGGALTVGTVAPVAGTGQREPVTSGYDVAPSSAALASVLAKMPIEDLDYESWIARLAWAKKACRGDPTVFAEVVLPWCARYHENTDEAVERKWDSIHDAAGGFTRLCADLRERGIAEAADFAIDFCPLPIEAPTADRRALDPEWVARYVYVLAVNRYVDRESLAMLPETVFDRLHSDIGHPSDSKKRASMRWQTDPGATKLAALTYRPGAARVVEEDGALALNTWSPSGLVPVPGDVTPWLAHMAYLIPDAGERETLLSWLAYLLQHPERKVNWAVLFGGAEGIGKNMAVEPVLAALGSRNWRTVSQADIDSVYTGWAAQTQLVVVEEVRGFLAGTMNKLKAYITVPPAKVSVNIKQVAHYEVPNQAAFLAYSNFEDALQIQRHDRRWMVIWSPAEPRGEAYYRGLAHWCDNNAGAVAGWLLARDLSTFDALGRAPMTEAKEAMRLAAATPLNSWLEQAMVDAAYPFDADLIVIEDMLARLPAHLKPHRPSERAVAAMLRNLGAKPLGKVRLGRVLEGSDRPRVWALRRSEMYDGVPESTLAALFWKGRDAAGRKEAGQDLGPVEDLLS